MKHLLGFESDAFYNCALVLHTFSSAHKILTSLKIERDWERIRNEEKDTISIIDIDLILMKK
jgi:7,8-dihydro-6-hydroxymethylpterin-pyrophosphokinase